MQMSTFFAQIEPIKQNLLYHIAPHVVEEQAFKEEQVRLLLCVPT